MNTAPTTETTRRNYVDFYSIETGDLLLAHDLDRPIYMLANAIGSYANRTVLEQVATAAGVTADRDSIGDMMLGWGQSFGTCTIVAERVFESTGTLGLTGGKLDGNRCDYTINERMREVRYVHRTDWN